MENQYFSFVKKLGHPRPLFRLFLAFFSQTSIEFYNKLMWKYVYQVYGVGIRTQSSGHESLPITTRPLFFFCLPRYVATFLDRSVLYQLYFLVSKQNRCRDTRHIVKNLFIKFANDCATCLSFFLSVFASWEFFRQNPEQDLQSQ